MEGDDGNERVLHWLREIHLMLWQARNGLIVPQRAALDAAGGGVTTDPNFSSVVLLAGFDGTNGAHAFSDESSKAHGAATFGGSGSFQAQLSNTQVKFGTASLETFSSGTPGGLSWPDSADWAFANGLFTVECFIYPTGLSGIQQFVGQWGSTGSLGWIFYVNSTTLKFNCSTTGSDNNADLSGGTLTNNVWHHIVVGFDGTTYRLGLNGTFTATSTTARNFHDSPYTLSVGSTDASAANFFFPGFVDELRITKGIWRYGSGSTYTVPTAAFPRS
jgi:hypothetical protein